jgi:hypothetical protein
MLLSRVITPVAPIAPDVGAYFIDLFDTPASTIASLHAQGKKVVCYFSSTSADDWREDWDQFADSDKSDQIPDWTHQYYVNIRNPDPTGATLTNVWRIMLNRINLAQQKGCDALDPDNTGKNSITSLLIWDMCVINSLY